MSETRAEILLPTSDVRADLGFFTQALGFRLDTIFPADNPRVVVLTGHGLRLRLDEDHHAPPGHVRLLRDDWRTLAEGRSRLVSPGGTRVALDALNPPLVRPRTDHAFVVRRLADQAPWVLGRAGMMYRDLVPSRLGGAMIASHIRVPDGKVPDMVHFHKVGFQLIFCIRGWVEVLYEDQGGPRRLHAGDCFVQPPQIRHRVLESGDGFEVIEIGVPADHVTEIDHQMTLPTNTVRPNREWDGQRFVHHIAEGAVPAPFRLPGFEARDTTVAANTGGVASVMIARPTGAPTAWTRHRGDILFTYVISGEMTLRGEGKEPRRLAPGDAFVIPPAMKTCYAAPTPDLQLLEVSLPGRFETEIL